MTPVLKAFKRLLSSNQLSTHYTEQLFATMDESVKGELTAILQNSIQRYSGVPVIRAVLDGSTDPFSHLQAIFDIFPISFFPISNELYKDAVHFQSAKLLQIAGIAATITRPVNQDTHIQLFVESIAPNETQEELKQKLTDASMDRSYIPKIIFNDFALIRKRYKNLVLTKDIHELIDMLFAFQGLLQIFLKYYFELICRSRSDEAALHIDSIFSNLFATLKYQEIKYWNNYTDSRTLQAELFHIIKMDAPSQRHPVLRKHLFDSLKQYNPIIKDARSRYSAPDVRQIHMGQLDEYNSLTIPKMAVLLRTVGRCKGRSNMVYLLSQTLKSQNQKLYELNEYVQTEAFQKDKELVNLIQYFVDKLSTTQQRANKRSSKSADMGTVIQTAESLRKMKAKKLLKEREAKGGLNYDQVHHLMQEKFKKMYTQAKSTGKLTGSTASDHVTEFATAAQPLFTSSTDAERKKSLQDFKVSTQLMLKDITDKGHLTPEEVKKFKLKIAAGNKQLATADPDRQASIMEQIGMAISNASSRSEKRYQIKVKRSKATTRKQQNALTYDQVTKFLETRLSDLYKRVRKDGALTQDKVSSYLSQFSESAEPLMVELSLEQQKAEIQKFKISTEDILKGFSADGTVPEADLKQFQNKIDKLTIHLDSPDIEKRSKAIQEIGLILSDASDTADSIRKSSMETIYSKAMTQDDVPAFIETYLKKLYARSRKDGALTYDQVSKYLSQFADAAQHIVVEIPPATRRKTIEEFKVSTDKILADISRQNNLTRQQVHKITIKLHGHINKLDVEDVQERIEVVDRIGLILADASEISPKKKKSTFDEEFYKSDCIPYGFDPSAKLVSPDTFFAFPFGDRKGPSENDWFNYHIKYLEIAVEKNKLEKSIFEKISSMLSSIPKKKYRKYFNIFPSEKFEETTFLAVYDLWQNKALEKLVVET